MQPYDSRKLKEFVCINSRPKPFDNQIIVGEHYMIDINELWDDDGYGVCKAYTMDDKYVGTFYMYHFEEVG